MKATSTYRLAVFIDADNTSSKIANDLFAEIAKIGEASLRRIYGDFSGSRLKGWGEILAQHAIQPYQQFSYTKGKNSSDIALVIDAMDILHSDRFDGFVLVSSDSDFTRLAARVREHSVDVFGIGKGTTPEAFRQACSRFIFTENFSKGSDKPDRKKPPVHKSNGADSLLNKAHANLAEADSSWVDLAQVGSQLVKIKPDFDPRTYGHSRLSKLIEATGQFEFGVSSTGGIQVRKISGDKKQSNPFKKIDAV